MTADLYQKYAVEIKIRDKLLGGKPKSDKLIAGWLESRGRQATFEKERKEIDTEEETEEREKGAWTGFKKSEEGLYLDSYQIKGMVKEVRKVLATSKLKRRGLAGLIQSGFFVYPARIYLGKKKPDGFVEETKVVQGRGGSPRSILTRHDYVEKAKINFEIRFFDTGVLTEELLKLIFEAGQEVGLGTNRHEGGEFAKFDLISLEKI